MVKIVQLFGITMLAVICITMADASDESNPPWEIPVIVVKYFPVRQGRIDINETLNWGETLEATQEKTSQLTRQLVTALEQGSMYHGYKDSSSTPSLNYRIARILEFREPLPTVKNPRYEVPMTDYNKIMERIDIKTCVEEKGIKEVWIWGYHNRNMGIWESNMSGPYGDISNSHRDPKDLPILSKTYTVYHYNYQRGLSEALEDHMHQIEHVLNWVDGRHRIPKNKWDQLLFWGRFVGSDISHKIVNPGCGWAHYPPNAEKDYDWANPRYVLSDIEDWRPDRSGKKQRINCSKWDGNSVKWFIYWMQNLPGMNSGLVYENKPLRNWWIFIGDFDYAMKNKMKLTAPLPKWKLVWSDEFDYEGLPDETKWDYEEGFLRNNEMQYYTRARRENARVENGMLVIEGRKEKLKNPKYKSGSKNWREEREFTTYTAASLVTFNKESWRYGRIEVRAKLPRGKGVWPAIWTLGVNRSKVHWPQCGEIDIMEFVGKIPDKIHGTVHFGENGRHRSDGGKLQTAEPWNDFHVYAIEWYEDRIDFFFDDIKYHTFVIDKAGKGEGNPFRKPHYLLINLALGGSWGGPIDDAIFPQKYLIDYVRVFELIDGGERESEDKK